MTDTEKLIKTVIKGRQVTYYLTTEDDLNNVKSNSLLGDIFFVLTSLAIGGIISVLLIKATSIELHNDTNRTLNILLFVFVALTVIFGVFSFFFYFLTYRTIGKIKESGAVKSLQSIDQADAESYINQSKDTKYEYNKLKIIKATYWTSKASLDVTEELRKLIVDNKLNIIASNNIKGDPDYGTVKKLRIDYQFNSISVTKEFTEGDKVVIP